MRRVLQYVLPGALAWALGACSGEPIAAPGDGVAAAGGVSQAARSATASCTYTPVQGNTGTTYDVLLSWSGLSVTEITIYTQSGVGYAPILQSTFGHAKQKGTLSVNVGSLPAYADLRDRNGGLGARVNCVEGGL